MSNLYMHAGIQDTFKLYKWDLSNNEFRPHMTLDFKSLTSGTTQGSTGRSLSNGGVLNTVFNIKLQTHHMFWVGYNIYGFTDISDANNISQIATPLSYKAAIWSPTIQPLSNLGQFQKYLIGNNVKQSTTGTYLTHSDLILVEQDHDNNFISELGTVHNSGIHDYFKYFYECTDLLNPHKVVMSAEGELTLNYLDNALTTPALTSGNTILTADISTNIEICKYNKTFLIFSETLNVTTNQVTIMEYNTTTKVFDQLQYLTLPVSVPLTNVQVYKIKSFTVNDELFISVLGENRRLYIYAYYEPANFWVVYQTIEFETNTTLLESGPGPINSIGLSFDIVAYPNKLLMLSILDPTSIIQELRLYVWKSGVGFDRLSDFDNKNKYDLYQTNAVATVSLGVA